ncbi:hypothetical protein H072_2315 [Dactylellina haptotyla CBS 200.50]|uniref:Uncharacterized protein n=1 Tax=Dactylellina haptotyla (strain CBS 200.50) TaxID=1284197 RepID=S8C7H9_DACHA|nr:hypothetical protein H072_2315 [Dactylellina haptotyla CBS 200.50]
MPLPPPRPPPPPPAVRFTKTFQSITFDGDNHIRGIPQQAVVLQVKRGGLIDINFPAPHLRKTVQFWIISKYTTMYWSESSNSIIWLINKKGLIDGFPKIFSRAEFGDSMWQPVSGPTIGKAVEALLGTKKFGVSHVFALKGIPCTGDSGSKDIRRFITHTRWQNIKDPQLQLTCREVLKETGMNFDFYFPHARKEAELKRDVQPLVLPRPPPPLSYRQGFCPARIVYEPIRIEQLVRLDGGESRGWSDLSTQNALSGLSSETGQHLPGSIDRNEESAQVAQLGSGNGPGPLTTALDQAVLSPILSCGQMPQDSTNPLGASGVAPQPRSSLSVGTPQGPALGAIYKYSDKDTPKLMSQYQASPQRAGQAAFASHVKTPATTQGFAPSKKFEGRKLETQGVMPVELGGQNGSIISGTVQGYGIINQSQKYNQTKNESGVEGLPFEIVSLDLQKHSDKGMVPGYLLQHTARDQAQVRVNQILEGMDNENIEKAGRIQKLEPSPATGNLGTGEKLINQPKSVAALSAVPWIDKPLDNTGGNVAQKQSLSILNAEKAVEGAGGGGGDAETGTESSSSMESNKGRRYLQPILQKQQHEPKKAVVSQGKGAPALSIDFQTQNMPTEAISPQEHRDTSAAGLGSPRDLTPKVDPFAELFKEFKSFTFPKMVQRDKRGGADAPPGPKKTVEGQSPMEDSRNLENPPKNHGSKATALNEEQSKPSTDLWGDLKAWTEGPKRP